MLLSSSLLPSAACNLALAAAFAVSSASAQNPTTPNRGAWTAWLGCWRPAQVDASVRGITIKDYGPAANLVVRPSKSQSTRQLGARAGSSNHVLCVAPDTGYSAVAITTISDGRVVSEERVNATGTRKEFDRGGCKGWEMAEWSKDLRRVYLKSEAWCDGGNVRRVSGVIAMNALGEWIGVQNVNVGEGNELRMQRFGPLDAVPSFVPPEISKRFAGREMAIQTARIAHRVALSRADIVDASRHLDANTVSAWLIVMDDEHRFSAGEIAEMTLDGVPSRVTDVLTALGDSVRYAVQFVGAERLPLEEEAALAQGTIVTAPSHGTAVTSSHYYYDYWGYSPFAWGFYLPFTYRRPFSRDPWMGRDPWGGTRTGPGRIGVWSRKRGND
jgi:hypothetical protein